MQVLVVHFMINGTRGKERATRSKASPEAEDHGESSAGDLLIKPKTAINTGNKTRITHPLQHAAILFINVLVCVIRHSAHEVPILYYLHRKVKIRISAVILLWPPETKKID